jgi:hypothetical protein
MSDKALELLQQIASDLNRSKRQFVFCISTADKNTEILLQVTSYNKTFKIGSLPLTHGKITISPASRTIPGPQRGSSRAIPFWNGSRLDRVHFCGFMANVRLLPVPLLQDLMVFALYSGRREECPLVTNPFYLSVSRTYNTCQFRNHPGRRRHAEIWACLTGILLL